MTIKLNNIQEFIDWVLSLDITAQWWLGFQNWCYAHSIPMWKIYDNYLYGIGKWNEFLGYSSGDTNTAYYPQGTTPTHKYSVGNILKHLVGSTYDWYKITYIGTAYNMDKYLNGKIIGSDIFSFQEVDNSPDWTLEATLPEPPPPEPPPPEPPPPEPPPPEPGGGGGLAMPFFIALLFLSGSRR